MSDQYDSGGETPPSAGLDQPVDFVDGEVVIASVSAAPKSRRSRLVGRLVGSAVVVAMAVGGAALAINAGSASGGAESAEAAVEELLAALSMEDLLGAAELMEPTERATLADAGVSIVDELKRLEVLAPEFDLGALAGIDLEFNDVVLRTVPVRSDIAQVYIDGGSSSASVDVSRLPLGNLILDRAPEDWLTFRESTQSTISFDSAIAAVKRDGRWYVSLWYSVAENIRIEENLPIPSVDDRPVPIGADSPEAAVERLLREALRLDPRTVIGMLDPEEFAVLYDYSPLFLDDAEAAANDILRSAAEEGLSWSLDSIELSSTRDGDLGNVTIDSLSASASGPEFSGSLRFGDDAFDLTWTVPGRRRPVTTSIRVEDGCTIVESDDADMMPSFDSCDEESVSDLFGLGPLSGLPSLGFDSVDGPADLGIVTRRVDGKWFVSPIRTVTTGVIKGLQAFTPEELADLVDELQATFDEIGAWDDTFYGDDGDFAFADAPTTSLPAGGFEPAMPTPVDIAEFEIENADLLPADIEVLWADDLAAFELSGLGDLWVPSLAPLGAERGVQAVLAGDGGQFGEVIVTVLVLTDESLDRAAPLVAAGAIDGVLETDFSVPSMAVLDGHRLLIVGGDRLSSGQLQAMLDLFR